MKAALPWGQKAAWGQGDPSSSDEVMRNSSPGCLVQIGEGKSKSGFSLGRLIFITSEFGDTGNGIWFSLQEARLAVQWVGAIHWHYGPFTHGPEQPHLFTVCLFCIMSLAAANMSFSRRCKKSPIVVCPGENGFSIANSKNLIYVLHITSLT